MNTFRHPKELAEIVAKRSVCAVQVGAVIVDNDGRVIAWGWNSAGENGLGQHAEEHALRRANRQRLEGATIFVYGQRKNAVVFSKPCDRCIPKLRRVGISRMMFSNKQSSTWLSSPVA